MGIVALVGDMFYEKCCAREPIVSVSFTLYHSMALMVNLGGTVVCVCHPVVRYGISYLILKLYETVRSSFFLPLDPRYKANVLP